MTAMRFSVHPARKGAACAIGAALFVAAAVSSAAAQGPASPGESAAVPDPDWIKLCSENPENNQQICVTSREQRAQTGQLIAAVSIREVEDQKFLVAAVPPGMLLRPGLQVQVDGSDPTGVAFSICFPNLCFAEAEIDGDYIDKLKRGRKLVITTLNQEARPVNFDISLMGFTASYEGEALDPVRLQEEQQRLQHELKRKADEARQQLIERQRQQAPAGTN
jgi:invasion protein IalB